MLEFLYVSIQFVKIWQFFTKVSICKKYFHLNIRLYLKTSYWYKNLNWTFGWKWVRGMKLCITKWTFGAFPVTGDNLFYIIQIRVEWTTSGDNKREPIILSQSRTSCAVIFYWKRSVKETCPEKPLVVKKFLLLSKQHHYPTFEKGKSKSNDYWVTFFQSRLT